MYLFLIRFLKKSQEIYSRQKNEQTVAFLSVRSSVYLKFILIWLFFIGIVFFLIWNGSFGMDYKYRQNPQNKKGGWKKTFFLSLNGFHEQ